MPKEGGWKGEGEDLLVAHEVSVTSINEHAYACGQQLWEDCRAVVHPVALSSSKFVDVSLVHSTARAKEEGETHLEHEPLVHLRITARKLRIRRRTKFSLDSRIIQERLDPVHLAIAQVALLALIALLAHVVRVQAELLERAEELGPAVERCRYTVFNINSSTSSLSLPR